MSSSALSRRLRRWSRPGTRVWLKVPSNLPPSSQQRLCAQPAPAPRSAALHAAATSFLAGPVGTPLAGEHQHMERRPPASASASAGRGSPERQAAKRNSDGECRACWAISVLVAAWVRSSSSSTENCAGVSRSGATQRRKSSNTFNCARFSGIAEQFGQFAQLQRTASPPNLDGRDLLGLIRRRHL